MSNKVRYNKSKTYLLPLLSEIVAFDKKFFGSLINVYMYDDLGKYKDCLFIEHDFTFRNPEYTKYENELINNELFVDLIDSNDMVIYIYKFPEEYINEYKYLEEGKYSKFGEDAKELILEFYTNIYQNNYNAVNFLLKLRQILFKNERLKVQIEKELNVTLNNDAELTDIIIKEHETFKLSKYIKDKEIKI